MNSRLFILITDIGKVEAIEVKLEVAGAEIKHYTNQALPPTNYFSTYC